VALLVVGLAAVGGGVYLMTRPAAGSVPKPAPKPSQSLAGSLISQLGGRAISYGIENAGSIEEAISDFFS
jgi:hypothetical protein